LFRPLSSISLRDLPDVGGKAARLGDALSLGAPVLPGVVLSTDLYRRFMRQGGLQGEIASILTAMQPRMITQFQAAEWAIRAAFQVRRTPDEVSRAIREAWRSLGGVAVAVRSSATSEDSPAQSFVGQHDTFLNIDSEERALESVIGCWMSLYSAKALAYARAFGVDLLSSSMAVIMQPMVQTASSGALFTADPISGNPDRFVLEIRNDEQTQVHLLAPYERQPGEHAIWSQLRHLGLTLDEHYMAYQSLEWTVTDEERLYLMRVRPLTNVPTYLPQSASEIGVSQGHIERIAPPDLTPRAMRPFSWYHRSRAPAMNAGHYRGANRLLSAYSGREDFFISGYLYVRWHSFALTPSEQIGPLRETILILRRLWLARSLDRQQRALWEEERSTLDSLRKVALVSLSSGELAEHLRQVIDVGDAFWEERGRLENVPQALQDIFCRLHQAWLDEPHDCDTLLWMPNDPHARWEDALVKLVDASFETPDEETQALETFCAQYGHFFLGQDPLADWRDLCTLDPDRDAVWAWLEQMRRQRAQAGVNAQRTSLADKRRQRLQKREMAEQRVLGRLNGLQRAVYRQVLHLARRYLPLDVQLDEPVRLARMLERRLVLDVGRRLQAEGLAREPDDACLLGAQEIMNWLNGVMQRDELVRLLMERKDSFRRWYRYAPPKILSAEPAVADEELGMDAAPEDILRGRPVSPGSAAGVARVVNTLAETTTILPGEVLVCREPLFELSPLFGIVAAVVAEQGSLLDHAGVLAREYGVPAVFGASDATRRIKNGEYVRVNANSGIIVRRPETEPEWEFF
jgi:rifampicin phosphotransferase